MRNIPLLNDLIIRDYRPEDYDQVANLWTVTGLSHPIRGDNAETIERTISMGGKFLILEIQSSHKICGTSWMTNDGRRILLHHFGILPEFQGKGYSNYLLKESLRFVKNTGMQVKLEVNSANTKAVRLYNKFGFKLLKDFNIYIIRDVTNM
jgi:ribosomal protein S18 acetylase RimI-like enzyme